MNYIDSQRQDCLEMGSVDRLYSLHPWRLGFYLHQLHEVSVIMNEYIQSQDPKGYSWLNQDHILVIDLSKVSQHKKYQLSKAQNHQHHLPSHVSVVVVQYPRCIVILIDKRVQSNLKLQKMSFVLSLLVWRSHETRPTLYHHSVAKDAVAPLLVLSA